MCGYTVHTVLFFGALGQIDTVSLPRLGGHLGTSQAG